MLFRYVRPKSNSSCRRIKLGNALLNLENDLRAAKQKLSPQSPNLLGDHRGIPGNYVDTLTLLVDSGLTRSRHELDKLNQLMKTAKLMAAAGSELRPGELVETFIPSLPEKKPSVPSSREGKEGISVGCVGALGALGGRRSSVDLGLLGHKLCVLRQHRGHI